jgi:tetratricopeptide (TPR) repeat protein
VKSRFPLASFCIVALFSCAFGQTFEVNGGNTAQQNQNQKKTSKSPAQSPDEGETNFGWGTSIETAREAHAADDALKRADYAAAMSFAERAANSAPQDAELWFLVGYCARLDEKYEASITAYDRGLKLKPGSIRGLAGLAQTYAKMGRNAEAEQTLQRVLDANPKDADSLELAGELFLATDANRALELLQRADALKPTAHTDLLVAHAYDRLGKPDESNRYIDRAKQRAPHDPDVLRAVAEQYRDQGKFDEAIASLQAIPNPNIDTQADLAYTYELAGRPQEASELYAKLARSAKGNINLNLSAAQSLITIGQPENAEPFLDEARRLDPNNYRLHAILGSVAEGDNRFDDAANEYTFALNHLPAVPAEGPLYPIELKMNLYEVKLRQEDEAGAKQQLDQAMAQINQVQVPDTEKPEMLRLRAAIEAGLGDTDAANKDLQQALALAPTNVNSLLNYASLEWKIGQKDAAEQTYLKVLQLDPNNRGALSSLGYIYRDQGDTKQAEAYFTRALKAQPKDFEPYLALGDLYGAERKFKQAESNYELAYQRMPTNPLIVAGGANIAIESHNNDLAKRWLDRAKGKMNDNPQVERERERYLTLNDDYADSAELGFKVLQKLPHDREGVDYLVYDLYYLGRFQEALELAQKYDPILPNDKDLPLIAGNVHVHDGQRREALNDFTRALERDPNMALGYADRGFVENDLRQPTKAVNDFESALKLDPKYGEAHLGLAYADLQLHRPRPALVQLEAVQRIMGKSRPIHIARAEAFRQEQAYSKAEPEYRIALQEDPNDLSTQLALADTLFRMRRYKESLATIQIAQRLGPEDPHVYALKAQVHAKEGLHNETMQDVQLAERYINNASELVKKENPGEGAEDEKSKAEVDILMSTGGALLSLGDRDGAMQRFERALDTPNGDRLGVRLAIAQVFLRQAHYDEARRQVALGFAEARMDSSQVTADDIEGAAAIFLSMHDFPLAETYFDKARLAGANIRNVDIGLANTFLAEGDTRKAADALANLGPASDFRDDYDYKMAEANIYRQRQDTVHALSSFAQANSAAGQQEQEPAENEEYEVMGEEGHEINQNFSLEPEGIFAMSLEDINVYTLDAEILHVTRTPSLLPPPRHSYQSFVDSHYRLHIGNLPLITGFVGESLTEGLFLFPSINVVQYRNTYDTIFNGGIVPVLHFGQNSITFNGGLQFTVRRDTTSPQFMSQNLFRQFLYVSTSSFFNWVSINGSAIREAGPFVDNDLHSRDADATIEFNVGRPWASTSLLAGYSARDVLYRPAITEYFDTATYLGLQRKFGSRITAAILAEDLRSWQVQDTNYAIAQAWLPGARFEFRVNPRWNVQGSFLLSRGQGYHQYDNAQSEFVASYTRVNSNRFDPSLGEVPSGHPFRVSFGVQQQTFYNFAGTTRNAILPVIHFNLF